MKTTQLDLFSANYAESGNANQLSSAPGEEPFAEGGSTDDCNLFLPAAGNRNGTNWNNVGSNGNYWSSTPNGSNAYNLNFNNGNCNVNNNNRNNGRSVRCVIEFAESSVPSFPVFRISRDQLLVDLFKAYYDARKHKLFFLLEEIILTDPTKNCIIKGKKSDWEGLPDNKSLFKTPADCGLPIGNLTSQLFSNIYLNRLDQLVKRQLREKHYGRYVDDSYIISTDYTQLRRHKATIRRYLQEELGLTLHPKKCKIVKCCYGLSFLGIFVKPHRLYISNRTKKRIFRKSAALLNCRDAEKLRAGINSYLGYLKHFKCGKIKERLFAGNPQLEHLGGFTGHYGKFCLHKLTVADTLFPLPSRR